jgi:hypothetical protein
LKRKYWTIMKGLFRACFGALSLLYSVGCGNAPSGASKEETAEPTGVEIFTESDIHGYTLAYQRRIADGARQGRFLRYNPDGVLVEEAYYHNDTLHGARIQFFPSGDTLAIEHYLMGRFEGEYRQYYENGVLRQIGRYHDNEMDGDWLQYYDGAELMEIVAFKHNAPNGPFREFYRNGQPKAEGRYFDGKEQGRLKLYDDQGRLEREMECEKGICRTVWKAAFVK